jgi:hypothetical protein
MRIIINRDLCDHVLPECEQCFARLVRNPLGEDRPCITEFVDDDDPTLLLTLRYEGREQVLTIPPESRELVASTGWSQFVDVAPRFYRT